MATSNSNFVVNLVLLLNRLSLGLYFLLAGVGKIQGGVQNFVNKGFKSMQPAWLPDVIATPYGYAIPFLEVVLGGILIIGLFTRIASSLIAIMIFSFTIALAISKGTLEHGPGPFNANFIMITLALLLAVTGAGKWSVDAVVRKKM